MKRMTVLLSAAVMVLGVAAPAMADYVRLGSVDVGYRTDMDTEYTRFGGRLESLRLTASRSDIYCRSIIVRFDSGDIQNVFSGRLDERVPVEVDLRGRARRVQDIRFVCRSNEYSGGRIHIAGEVGRYRDEWRRDRDWDRTWSGMFGGDRDFDHGRRGGGDWGGGDWGGGGSGDWVSLGTQSFEGRNDHESNFTGWAGRHVDRIGFRPIDGDARCMSVVVQFEDGQKVKLVSGVYMMDRGRMSVFDFPGHSRNLVKVYMRCRAVGDYRVAIEVFAHR
jgi:hypothetical protein